LSGDSSPEKTGFTGFLTVWLTAKTRMHGGSLTCNPVKLIWVLGTSESVCNECRIFARVKSKLPKLRHNGHHIHTDEPSVGHIKLSREATLDRETLPHVVRPALVAPGLHCSVPESTLEQGEKVIGPNPAQAQLQ
jgi:hypothetical protein